MTEICEKYRPILLQIAVGNEPEDTVIGALARAHALECDKCGVAFMEACGEAQEFKDHLPPRELLVCLFERRGLHIVKS